MKLNTRHFFSLNSTAVVQQIFSNLFDIRYLAGWHNCCDIDNHAVIVQPFRHEPAEKIQVHRTGNKIIIDTGAFFTGMLIALDIKTGEIYRVTAVGD